MNFEHIKDKWPELHQLAAFAEEYAISDPQSALVKLRCFAEKVVGFLYKELRLPVFPNSNIYDKLTADDFTSAVPSLITDKLHAIRKSGNQAAHIKDVKVPLPDLDSQKKFREIYISVRAFLKKVKGSGELSEQEFNSLSQKAFAGEL